MKKFAWLLVLMIIVSPVLSFAAESAEESVRQMAQSLLTEVYGYTQEEADHFTYAVSDENDVWAVRFYNNPEWVYKAWVQKKTMEFTGSTSPFTTLNLPKAPENSVRYVLRAIADNGWMTGWNEGDKAAMGEAIEWCGDIRMTASLSRGLRMDGYAPAQALSDFFLSCYGETALWSQEVSEWRDAVFASFGLALEEAVICVPDGIVEYVADRTANGPGTTICEFAGAVPDTLAQAFSRPELAGWECIAGAYQARNKAMETDTSSGMGLAAFARGDERLLAMLIRDAKALEWEVLPVSDTALLMDRDLYIAYGGSTGRFDIVYPVSDTETEYFRCRLAYIANTSVISLFCSLEEYCRVNEKGNTMLEIDSGTSYSDAKWYHVVTTQSGVRQEALYSALCPGVMEYIDASAFPKTEEECRIAAEASPTLPEGYGMTSNVHLRAKASSHSDDLGMYRIGTLVEVLDSQPGADYPWYHVRVGVAEGYMSGNYVAYKDDRLTATRFMVLGMGKLTADTALKEGTGIFSQTVAELPAGSIVRVLAERGDWLHVSVPSDEGGWLMRPDEINGYVKSNAVEQGATAMQLEWLYPED